MPSVVCIAGAEFCEALGQHSSCQVFSLGMDRSVEDAIRAIRSSGAQAVIGVEASGSLAAWAAYEAREVLVCQILVCPVLDTETLNRRDWTAAPPALIITSRLDPRRNEAESHARRLEACGVPVELTSCDGAPESIWLCAERLRETFGLPVRIPISDVLNLHTVHPKDIHAVVEEYLSEARRLGYRQVRLIHGRGIGVQREIVRSILARTPFVRSFSDAPPEAGGWGATLAELH